MHQSTPTDLWRWIVAMLRCAVRCGAALCGAAHAYGLNADRPSPIRPRPTVSALYGPSALRRLRLPLPRPRAHCCCRRPCVPCVWLPHRPSSAPSAAPSEVCSAQRHNGVRQCERQSDGLLLAKLVGFGQRSRGLTETDSLPDAFRSAQPRRCAPRRRNAQAHTMSRSVLLNVHSGCMRRSGEPAATVRCGVGCRALPTDLAAGGYGLAAAVPNLRL